MQSNTTKNSRNFFKDNYLLFGKRAMTLLKEAYV